MQVHNNQRDGMHRQAINRGRVAYEPNSLAGGCPFQAGAAQGFVSVSARIAAKEEQGKQELRVRQLTQLLESAKVGEAPAANGAYYQYNGKCLPMTVEHFDETALPKPGSLGGPAQLNHTIYLTRHGVVQGWTTVKGKPVAIVDQRSTYNHDVDSVVAYRTVGVPIAPEIIADVAAGSFDAILVTSGSVANQIAVQIGLVPSRTVIACIGPRTAVDAEAAGLRVDLVARERSSESLIDTLEELARRRPMQGPAL